jgi:hypothetical protein
MTLPLPRAGDTVFISPTAKLLSDLNDLKQADIDRIEASVGYSGALGVGPVVKPRSYYDQLQDHKAYARGVDDAIKVVMKGATSADYTRS